tara:strand:- start:577 stop:927 length:351 start_codon:yes stop_codon:yes gene_type:complete
MNIKENEWAEIKITANHIKDGMKNDCNNCPIALAIREEMCGRNLLANVKEAEDITLITKMDMKGVWAVVDVHEDDKDEIDRFIHDFDGGWLDHHSVDIRDREFTIRCQLNENQIGE